MLHGSLLCDILLSAYAINYQFILLLVGNIMTNPGTEQSHCVCMSKYPEKKV